MMHISPRTEWANRLDAWRDVAQGLALILLIAAIGGLCGGGLVLWWIEARP